jgi:hypothetical protein
MLAVVMAGQGELMRHLRIVPRVVRRNAALGHDAFGFGQMVNHWITYWHFASVTRQISGTEFGNVPEGPEVREGVAAGAVI